MEEGRFINIRKLAALYITFRGGWRIVLEYGLGAVFFGVAGIAILLLAAHPTLVTMGVGVYLLFISLNCIPLLGYSVAIMMKGSARLEVDLELTKQDAYRKKYGVQQALILMPLAILILSVVQESAK